MRLIDADALKKNYTNTFAEKYGVKGAEMFRDIVNQMPTAYDPEAVVKELKKNADSNEAFYRANLNDNAQGQMFAYLHAIEIVRKGGVT